jgi:hypothetical protein
LAVKAHLQALKEQEEMSALFPSFLSLGQRIKRLLATDVKAIWQSLEEKSEQEMQLTEFQPVLIYPHW